jgi:hypothetical protein
MGKIMFNGESYTGGTGDGGESQCGAFVDYTDLIATVTFTNGSASYTATTDCYAIVRGYYVDNTTAIQIKVDGVLERGSSRVGSAIEPRTFVATSVLLKKGQTLTVENCLSTTNDNYIKIYGLQYSSPNLQPVIYSEEEREIGVWIDGKPLYQKTIIGTVSNNPEIFFVGEDYDVDEYIHVFGKLKSINSADEFEFIETGYVNVNNYAGFYNSGGTRKNLKLYYNTDSYHIGSTYYITIQYTKTTDTAGSGKWTPQGVPAVHYSTDEQVVGTWIDGSPVYEKTYIKTMTSGTTDCDFPFTDITDYKTIIELNGLFDGAIPFNLSGACQGTSRFNITSLSQYAEYGYIQSSGIRVHRNSAIEYSPAPIVIVTIRYIKSST